MTASVTTDVSLAQIAEVFFYVAEAYRHLRHCRWQATLNDRQLAGLADFAEAWVAAPEPAREPAA